MTSSRAAADPRAAPPRWRVLRGTLQQKLLTLVVLSVVPTAVFAFLLALLHWQTHEKLLAQTVEHHATTLAVTVERDVESVLARLRYIATSPFLAQAHLGEFHARLHEIVQASPDVRKIVLLDAQGETIMDSAVPYGRTPPRAEVGADLAAAYAAAEPVVSGVRFPASGAATVKMAMPVLRNDSLEYVLVAHLDLSRVRALLQRRDSHAGSIAAILDAELRHIVHTQEDVRLVGQPAPPGLAAAIRATPAGGTRRMSLADGPELWTAWIAVPALGWTATYGIPAAPALRAQRRHLLLIFAGGAAILLGGIALALVLSRELTRGLRALAQRAPALSRGSSEKLPRVGIDEIDRLSQSLEDASRQLALEADLRGEAERERDRLLASERQAREEAEEANRGKDAFLAMLGHELRNPASAIANAAHVMSEADTSGEHRSFAASVIQRQVRQLTRLVEDLLDVAKSAHGKLTMHYARLDLQACVHQTIDAVRDSDGARERELSLDTEPVYVIADPARMQQITTNLLNNALAHTAPGGRIEVTLKREDTEAVLSVRDDGAGMAPEVLERIFEPFYQSSGAGKPRPGSLGLGLTLVQRLVTVHNGHVSAHSAGPGKGATFCVRLPLAPDVAEPAREAPGPAAPVGACSILLVEDNEDVRETLRIALALAGHRVRAFADGESALAASAQARPDVAILDIGLPGMDGGEVARLLRADRASIFIIAFTGFGSPGSDLEPGDARFDAQLLKPVKMDALAALLQRAADRLDRVA